MTQFRGRSDNVQGVFLGSEFWEEGTKIIGTVLGSFSTENGVCYRIHLSKPVEVAGQTEELVSIGALKGFGMALQDAGLTGLQPKDKIVVLCTGRKQTGKASPLVEFEIEVHRA